MTRRTVHDMVAEAKAAIEEISVDELAAEMEGGDVTVVDIRDIRERIKLGSVPGALSAPRGMLEFWFDPESPYYQDRYQFGDRYVFYCAGGMRSALAAKAISDIGYTNVAHLEPGFAGWLDSGRDVEDVASTSPWVKRS